MQHPLSAFHDWFAAQDPLVRTDVASFIFLGLPDSGIGHRHFIEHEVEYLLKVWIDEKMSEDLCRVLGTATALRAVIEFFLMSTRSSPARSASLTWMTDATLEASALENDAAWHSAREGWKALCNHAFSDSSLDAWSAADVQTGGQRPVAENE